MQDDLNRALAHAEEEVAKAEATIRAEVAAGGSEVQSHLDSYINFWTKSAGELLDNLKPTLANKDCPDLLHQFQSITSSALTEDWRRYLTRAR